MQPTVFLGSALLLIAFVAYGAGWTDSARALFTTLQRDIAEHFGWFYAATMVLCLVVAVGLALTRFGRLRMGHRDERPEFSRPAWLAMLFAAGMGTGLVFYGVAEPILHAAEFPDLPDDPDARRRVALRVSMLHWGLHPWAVYVVFGATLGIGHFRYGLPLAPRTLLWPFLGQRLHGPIGHVVDILCTVGTLVGVAASLGLGSMQINAGLERAGWVALGTEAQLAILGTITLAATISVVSGLDHGIRTLSLANACLAGLLMLFVLCFGPTADALANLVRALGDYLVTLPATSVWVAEGGEAQRWQREWTFSYWGWWLAWSPFVGVFVARISRGRTYREFATALMLVPVVGSGLWMSVFGTAAFDAADRYADFGPTVREAPARALHELLSHLPVSGVTFVAATVLTTIFFITSSDSGSLVDDMVTSGGDPNPPRAQRVFWAVTEGVVAATLVYAGGIEALRTAALTIGLPLGFLVCVAAVGLSWLGLRLARKHRRRGNATSERVDAEGTTGAPRA